MEKKITVAGQEIVARTLTVEQIADLLEQLDGKRKLTLAEMLMDSDIPEEFILAGTGLPSEWFKGAVTPDDISQVWGAFSEANSFLSRMLPRLSVVGKTILEQQEQPSCGKTSAE